MRAALAPSEAAPRAGLDGQPPFLMRSLLRLPLFFSRRSLDGKVGASTLTGVARTRPRSCSFGVVAVRRRSSTESSSTHPSARLVASLCPRQHRAPLTRLPARHAAAPLWAKEEDCTAQRDPLPVCWRRAGLPAASPTTLLRRLHQEDAHFLPLSELHDVT
ncbi:hypothetical protein BJY59DRAFT_702325, partial [Rhodotorula toruloides]